MNQLRNDMDVERYIMSRKAFWVIGARRLIAFGPNLVVPNAIVGHTECRGGVPVVLGEAAGNEELDECCSRCRAHPKKRGQSVSVDAEHDRSTSGQSELFPKGRARHVDDIHFIFERHKLNRSSAVK